MSSSGDKLEVGGIVLPVDVDLSGLLKGLEESKRKAKEHTSEWSAASATFAGIMATEMVMAVKDFVVSSVREYVKLDQALDRTAKAVQRLGGTYAEARKKIDAYADSVEQLTEFSDEEAANSLHNLIRLTQNLDEAMAINKLSMDVASQTGEDLAGVSQRLGLAYLGNERGLMQTARQLGIVGDKAKDTDYVFKELEKRYGGMAVANMNAASEFKRFTNEMGNFGEAVGSVVLPVLTDMSLRLRSLFGNDLANAQVRVQDFTRMIKQVEKDMSIQQPDFIMKSKAKELEYYTKLLAKAQADIKRLQGTLPGAGSKLNPHESKATQDDREKAAEQRTKQAEEAKKRRLEDIRDITDEINAEENEYLEQVQKMQSLFAGPVASTMQTFFAGVLDGTKQLYQVFEALGKAIAKSMLNAVAMVLEQKAAVNIVEGLAAAASIVGAAAAPGFFAAAAIQASGAGAVRAVAASLADGGILHPRVGGHIVQVAEAGQAEVVTPLNKLQDMIDFGGGKGGTNNISVNFPGVRKASDFTPSMAKSAARMLLDQVNELKIRSGQRAGFA